MQILLDEKTCDLVADSVGAAIDAAADVVRGRGRLIVDVAVDGQSWPEASLADPEQTSVEAERIEITTAEPTELLSAMLADALKALDRIETLHTTAGDHLERGEMPAAMAVLGESLQIWSQLEQAVRFTAPIMSIDLGKPLASGLEPRVCIDLLGERLKILRSALQADDQIGISDTLLYDFPECVQQWRSLITALRDVVCTSD